MRRNAAAGAPPPLAELQRTLMRALYAPPSAHTQRAKNWGQARIVALPRFVPDPNSAPQAGSREALALYRRMGALRFEREVAREFPAVRALLGGEKFAALARAFVASHRSRSFTLEGYADALPHFIARERGRTAAQALASFELALRRAERARTKPGAPRPGALAHAPGARVLDFAWDVASACAALRRTGQIERMPRRRSRVVIFQRAGRAKWLEIGASEARLLASLLRGARVDRAVARTKLSPARIRGALQRWVAAGLLAAPRSRE